jgi:Tfp pilus assembly protein PilV
MRIKVLETILKKDLRCRDGFTLVEALISTVLSGFAITGLIVGYATMARRAEFAVYSTAATALAQQGIEQARAAKWDTAASPAVDEVVIGNFPFYSVIMDITPDAGVTVRGTNYFQIVTVSTNPPLKHIQVDCVWSIDQGENIFTNTLAVMRAPDQ